MNDLPEIKPMGEQGILIDFTPEVSESQLNQLLHFKKFLQESLLKQRVEVINTFNSLLINYHEAIEDVYSEVSRVKKLLEQANVRNNFKQHLFHVPVCYEEDFGLDLALLCRRKNLTKKELIIRHTAPVYTVYFIGFLPGFLYLGGLDEKLHFPRKDQPRLKVEKGAVGIGENQTGIYPKSSPGGWQIIGNSPVPLFDKDRLPPCEISPGDKLKFYPVDLKEHNIISEEVRERKFEFKKEIYVG